MNKEKKEFPEESLPTEYLDALKKSEKEAEEELKDLSGDYKAEMERSVSDYAESLKRNDEQNREELKELSEDHRVAYEQAMNHGSEKREDDEKDELIFDRHAGIDFNSSGERHKEKDREDEPEKKEDLPEKEFPEEAPKEKSEDHLDNSPQEEKIKKEETEKPVISEKQIEEAVSNLSLLYEKRKEASVQKEKERETLRKLAVKKDWDSEIDKEYRAVNDKYQKALENVMNLTGKSEEEIVNEYLEKEEAVTSPEKLENIEKKLDEAEKSTEKREQEQSPEKKSLSEKIVAGLKDKRVQLLLIKAVIAGGIIAIPVGGAVAAAAGMGLGQALGIGTFITYSTAAEGAAIGVSNVALGVAGGALLSRLMRQARELMTSKKSTEENIDVSPNAPAKELKKEKIISPELEEIPQTGPEKEPVKEATPATEEIEWIPYAADVPAEYEVENGEEAEDIDKEKFSIELKDDEFSQVKSFDELYAKLNELGSVDASDGSSFSLEDIKKRIEYLRKERENSPFSDNIITRSGGLREKVRQLIDEEKEKEGLGRGGTLNWVE
jgi:hypothetical protein